MLRAQVRQGRARPVSTLSLLILVIGAACFAGSSTWVFTWVLKHNSPRKPVKARAPAKKEVPAPYLAMCVAVKDQGKDLREWIHYHHWLGFERFYIFDHNSSEALLNYVDDYIKAGIVEYHFFSGHTAFKPGKFLFPQSGQGYAYNDCLRKVKTNKHQWAAFFDMDEFLVLNNSTAEPGALKGFMKQYEKNGGLVVHWRVFGSSGHETRPAGSVMESYTKCHEKDFYNSHVKTIVNVPFVDAPTNNPHIFKYAKGKFAVREDFSKCTALMMKPATYQKIALHHYVLKSAEEFKEKQARGGGAGKKRDDGYFKAINALATRDCLQGVEVARVCCANKVYNQPFDYVAATSNLTASTNPPK